MYFSIPAVVTVPAAAAAAILRKSRRATPALLKRLARMPSCSFLRLTIYTLPFCVFAFRYTFVMSACRYLHTLVNRSSGTWFMLLQQHERVTRGRAAPGSSHRGRFDSPHESASKLRAGPHPRLPLGSSASR